MTPSAPAIAIATRRPPADRVRPAHAMIAESRAVEHDVERPRGRVHRHQRAPQLTHAEHVWDMAGSVCTSGISVDRLDEADIHREPLCPHSEDDDLLRVVETGNR